MTQTRLWVAGLIIAALLVVVAVAGIGEGPNRALVEKAESATAPRGDGRGVTAPTATLLAGGLAVFGTLFGVGLGLVGDRYLRHRGDILCQPSEWSMTCTLRDLWNPSNTHPVRFSRSMYENKRVLERAEYAGYGVRVKLFNETEVATGLRDIRVVFTDDSGVVQKVSVPTMVDSRNFSMDPDAVNLPARQWVATMLTGKVETEDFEALARSTIAKLRAWLPKDRLFERPIARLWD
jgi:hypothetical protein